MGRVRHTGDALPEARVRYCRVPWEVATDDRLSGRDVRVYTILAGQCWQGNTAYIGARRIAELAAYSERLTLESLKALSACGHIAVAPRKRGERSRYELTSKVFGKKQRDGVEEIVSRPNGAKRLVSVRVA